MILKAFSTPKIIWFYDTQKEDNWTNSIANFRQENVDIQEDKESYFQEIESNGTAARNLVLNIFIVVVFVQSCFLSFYRSKQKQETDSELLQKNEKCIFA